ncbi:hypothetical protein NHX12_025536 [Muraenolepis orangiensis]|uniref:Uncharacterized protein n=1 Tax=Muraenolepis orangiensis TaxID=630683 RepID=A0A9Q0EK60_9TELE|nr:hypothetical protein NHX12_025536 [Muraenolepis orangiensis]
MRLMKDLQIEAEGTIEGCEGGRQPCGGMRGPLPAQRLMRVTAEARRSFQKEEVVLRNLHRSFLIYGSEM